MEKNAESYLEYLSTIKRYSKRTLELYRKELDSFLSFCGPEITRTSVRNYEVYLMEEKKLGAASVNLALSTISGFCRYLVKKSILESNPLKQLPRPKTPKRLPTFYQDSSMEEYFSRTEAAVTTGDLSMEKRYKKRLSRCIISTLYSTGIRRSELIGLKIGDVDLGRKMMDIRGKGDKMREIPLVDSLCEEISLYLSAVESMVGCERKADSPLLVTEKGRKLYPVYVDRVVKSELGAVRDITGRKSPHVLRHSLATELLNEGTDIYSIKELLGHASLAATEIYTHNTIEKLKKVYNKAHPRAKKGGKNGDSD